MSAVNSSGFQADDATPPKVSFAIACYNALPFLSDAIQSALDQREVSVELVIVDDGSSDGSLEQARALAQGDPRVRVFQTPRNSGPAGARNIALDAMRGEWFAILDSDDLIDPDRSRILIEAAEREGADLVADNLRVFGEGLEEQVFFPQSDPQHGYWLDLDQYFRRSRLFGKTANPGFMKPMIRRSALDRTGVRYNEALRIGEDDELIVRLLLGGCRYYVLEDALYRYRKHASSISHRLSAADTQRMIDAEAHIRHAIGAERARSAAYKGRWKALERGLAFNRSVECLKAGNPVAAALAILREPGALPLYRMPLESGLRRIFTKGT